MSAASTTASTWRGSITSVTSGRPGLGARLLQDLERLLAEPLEGVRRGARLEGAAAEHRHALGGDGARGLERLLARLDRARAGDEAEVAVADAAAAHLDHGRIGRQLAGDELVRLEDRQHLLDPGEALERQRREQLALADRADHRRLAAGRDECRAAGFVEPRDDLVHLLLGGARAHHDQQLRCACDRHRNSLGRITSMAARPPRSPASSPASSRPGERRSATTAAASASTSRRRSTDDGVLLHRRPALDHVEYDPQELRDYTLDLRGDAVRDRARPGPLDRLLPEPRHRARRGRRGCCAPSTSYGELRPHDAVQGEVRPARTSSRPASSRTPS